MRFSKYDCPECFAPETSVFRQELTRPRFGAEITKPWPIPPYQSTLIALGTVAVIGTAVIYGIFRSMIAD